MCGAIAAQRLGSLPPPQLPREMADNEKQGVKLGGFDGSIPNR